MKRLVFFFVSLLLTFMISNSVMAADINHGEEIFTANCAACHVGGNNVIMPEKTLKIEALEKFTMNSVDAITNQVTNGKNSMPAFGGRLSETDIEDVANYVLTQAKDEAW
uniref:cytochrome c553 n=1 Tax=Rhodaphanes brevistipitata TaxID=446136 RepID=UPI001FCDA825|nr:cytochrome c553 [Rhodaphanes brevistipitata]UNJ18421.1 cytochrome c553 [Rhodaphanes brevistipitata]